MIFRKRRTEQPFVWPEPEQYGPLGNLPGPMHYCRDADGDLHVYMTLGIPGDGALCGAGVAVYISAVSNNTTICPRCYERAHELLEMRAMITWP